MKISLVRAEFSMRMIEIRDRRTERVTERHAEANSHFFAIVRTHLKMLKTCGRLGYDSMYFGMRFLTFQSNVLLLS